MPYVTLAPSLDLRSSPRIFEQKKDCSQSIQKLTAGRLQEGSIARECGCHDELRPEKKSPQEPHVVSVLS